VTEQLCAETNVWLETELQASEPLRQIVANLLLCGSSRGGVHRGQGGFRASDLLDAARGYIVREKTDPWHAERRRGDSPVTLVWVLRSTERVAEYAETGRRRFEAWKDENQAARAEREEIRTREEEFQARINACSRDHDRERTRAGKHWMCPDRCGWHAVMTYDEYHEGKP
jgi:hypothetical protein